MRCGHIVEELAKVSQEESHAGAVRELVAASALPD